MKMKSTDIEEATLAGTNFNEKNYAKTKKKEDSKL